MKITEEFKKKVEEYLAPQRGILGLDLSFEKELVKAFKAGTYYGYEQGMRDVVKELREAEDQRADSALGSANWISEHFGLSEEGGKDE